MVSKRTPKITVRRRTKGYRNPRSGKWVKSYNRTIKVFPNHYFTMLIDSTTGEDRLAEVWVKGKQRRYRWVEDHRKAKKISFERARKHFNQLPEKRQKADKRHSAKNTFERDEITTKYLSKYGTKKYDVQDLDTPIRTSMRLQETGENYLISSKDSTEIHYIREFGSLIKDEPMGKVGIFQDKSNAKKVMIQVRNELLIDSKVINELQKQRDPLIKRAKQIETKLEVIERNAGTDRNLGIIIQYPRGEKQKKLADEIKDIRREITRIESRENQLKLQQHFRTELKPEWKKAWSKAETIQEQYEKAKAKKESKELSKKEQKVLDLNNAIQKSDLAKRKGAKAELLEDGTINYSILARETTRPYRVKSSFSEIISLLPEEEMRELSRKYGKLRTIEKYKQKPEESKADLIKRFLKSRGYKEDEKGNLVKGDIEAQFMENSFSIKRSRLGTKIGGGYYSHYDIDPLKNKIVRNAQGVEYLKQEKARKEELIKEKAKTLPTLKEGEKYYIVSFKEGEAAHYHTHTTNPEKAMRELKDSEKFFEVHNLKGKVEIISGTNIDHVRAIIDKRERKKYDNYSVSGNTYIHKNMLKRLGLKWDYNAKMWRGKLSTAEVKYLEKYSDIKVESDKEYTKEERKKSQKRGVKQRTERLRKEEQKYKAWENKYRPFTQEQISAYNTYSHYNVNINDNYENRIKTKENELKKILKIKNINDAKPEIRVKLNRFKKELYHYYLEESRARSTAPSPAIVGSAKYINFERKSRLADTIRKNASIKRDKAEKALDKEVSLQYYQIKKKEIKTINFGPRGTNINPIISKIRKDQKLDITQHTKGTQNKKEYRMYLLKTPNKKSFMMEVSETGTFTITPYNRPSERLVSKKLTSLNEINTELNKFIEREIKK